MTSDSTAVEAIAALARQATLPQELEPGGYYVVHAGDGTVLEIDLTGDDHLDRPKRIKAHPKLSDVDSLLDYWDKHHDNGSDLYADRQLRTITAILDAHAGTSAEDDHRPAFQSHRATVTLAISEAWATWVARNGKPFTQEEFAEFIEDQMPYIADPDAATLVEMAQTFQATSHASFKSGYRIQNGQRVFSYTETIDGRMSDGEAVVPQKLTLHLPIWRGSQDSHEITARLRYRLSASRLTFLYLLDRAAEIVDASFAAEVARVAEHIGRPVLRGVPA